jgi:hypothetical protein
MTTEEWVTMREAATRLKISYNKLSRLVALGEIQTKSRKLDRRVRLVEINEVKKIFELT